MKTMISESELFSAFLQRLRQHDLRSTDIDIVLLDIETGGANWRPHLLPVVPQQTHRDFVSLYARLRRDFDLLPVD